MSETRISTESNKMYFRTENTPMIVGLGEAARIYNEASSNIETVLCQNRDYFEELLVVSAIYRN